MKSIKFFPYSYSLPQVIEQSLFLFMGRGEEDKFFCTLLQNIILICFCHCHPEPLRLLWQLCLSPEEAPKTIICASVQKSPPNSFLFLQNLLKAVVFSRIFFTTLRKGGSIWLSHSLLLYFSYYWPGKLCGTKSKVLDWVGWCITEPSLLKVGLSQKHD